jgi:glycosyltransferase involved in cell wall biosynthesis
VYVGELDAEGKRTLLADATALLNPIEWAEPFGMAMVEAMACGTPVVGGAKGAAPEIVEQGVTGFLADTDEALVKGLRSVTTIDRAACRRRVAEHFSVARMVEGYVQVYHRASKRA